MRNPLQASSGKVRALEFLIRALKIESADLDEAEEGWNFQRRYSHLRLLLATTEMADRLGRILVPRRYGIQSITLGAGDARQVARRRAINVMEEGLDAIGQYDFEDTLKCLATFREIKYGYAVLLADAYLSERLRDERCGRHPKIGKLLNQLLAIPDRIMHANEASADYDWARLAVYLSSTAPMPAQVGEMPAPIFPVAPAQEI